MQDNVVVDDDDDDDDDDSSDDDDNDGDGIIFFHIIGIVSVRIIIIIFRIIISNIMMMIDDYDYDYIDDDDDDVDDDDVDFGMLLNTMMTMVMTSKMIIIIIIHVPFLAFSRLPLQEWRHSPTQLCLSGSYIDCKTPRPRQIGRRRDEQVRKICPPFARALMCAYPRAALQFRQHSPQNGQRRKQIRRGCLPAQHRCTAISVLFSFLSCTTQRSVNDAALRPSPLPALELYGRSPIQLYFELLSHYSTNSLALLLCCPLQLRYSTDTPLGSAAWKSAAKFCKSTSHHRDILTQFRAPFSPASPFR